MTNKKLNIILGIICVVLICLTLLFIDLAKVHEDSQVFFTVDDISNKTYSDEDSDSYFISDGNTLTLKLNGKDIYTEKEFKLNKKTGEITVDNKSGNLYLLTVNDDYIEFWYKKAEYRIDREVVLK